MRGIKRPCVKIEPNTGRILSFYDTLSDAHTQNNITISGIIDVCLGKRNSAGGFIWLYRDHLTFDKLTKSKQGNLYYRI